MSSKASFSGCPSPEILGNEESKTAACAKQVSATERAVWLAAIQWLTADLSGPEAMVAGMNPVHKQTLGLGPFRYK